MFYYFLKLHYYLSYLKIQMYHLYLMFYLLLKGRLYLRILLNLKYH